MRNPAVYFWTALFLSYLISSVEAGSIFWTDPLGSNVPAANIDVIKVANFDGTGIRTLVTGLQEPRGMTLDLVHKKIYWAEPESRIARSNFDGTGVETVIETSTPGVALDTAHGKMYWTEGHGNGKVRRANLDGSNTEDLVTFGPPSHPVGIAVDSLHAKMYWTDLDANKIQWADLDGSNVQDLVTGVDAVYSIAVDPEGGKIYWPELATDKIQRANLDGTSIEDVVAGLDTPTSVALNTFEGKIYWTDSEAFGQINRIERANLDGSSREVIVSGIGFPWGIAVVPEPNCFALFLIGTFWVVGCRVR